MQGEVLLDPLILILALLVLLLLAVFFIWWQTHQRFQRLEEKGLSQEQLDTLAQRLLDSDRRIQEATTQSFGQIQKNLGELARTSQNMEELGKEISGLSDLLRAPKLRGGLGELFLGDLLSQILTPEQYSLQHTFRSGERVDAVISLKAGMVPVDSKFPLESFQRLAALENEEERKKARREFVAAVKKHIDDIARKYILPDEGTFEFALMYIPAEAIYYETILKDESVNDALLDYALQKRVIPVSPNSFYAYLQAIALGLKGLRIEQQAREIMDHLARLQGDMARFRKEFDTLGGHIQNAYNKYDEAERRLARLEDKLLAAGEAPEQLELPPPEAPE
ncbi:MAG: DNA recombination protein RmuC [Chloroflexi bacterium]|nr:DNA recombination protein RmuC [Chloroflexota bacterium]